MTMALVASPVLSFTGLPPRSIALRKGSLLAVRQAPRASVGKDYEFDPFGFTTKEASATAEGGGLDMMPSPLVLAGVAALAGMPEDALAKGGEYGIFEGRISSMAHPVIMGGCFLVSLGSAYTGFQWRRIRDIVTEVGEMKTTLSKEKLLLERYAAMEERTPADEAALKSVQGVVDEMQREIDEKSQTRKDLLAKDFRGRHWALGAVLLGIGISFAIEGPVNTYMRAGKLFPGPHLYAGAGCVCLWALGAALVPNMQKGQEWARSSHIALNVISTALFAYYQIPTGLTIAGKVIANTKFP